VTKITVGRRGRCFSQEDQCKDENLEEVTGMLTSILVALIVTGAIGYAIRAGRNGKSILKRPYNNRYNDATGAREDRLG
jgi:hypothetical protein